MGTRTRKLMLTAHITSSVAWIGAVAAFLALAVLGLIRHGVYEASSLYPAMQVIAWIVIVPLAFASLISGVIASLGTPWGLFRYYWIVVKLLITLLATAMLLVHMRPVDALADMANRTGILTNATQGMQWLMVIASALAIAALLVALVLSTYKPKGVTPWATKRAS